MISSSEYSMSAWEDGFRIIMGKVLPIHKVYSFLFVCFFIMMLTYFISLLIFVHLFKCYWAADTFPRDNSILMTLGVSLLFHEWEIFLGSCCYVELYQDTLFMQLPDLFTVFLRLTVWCLASLFFPHSNQLVVSLFFWQTIYDDPE